ncbi:MAG: type II toxin-antitoxin system MqsA family antitoxin [Bacilli bacterium]|nr:type II toxin-antitoxin system MqsA family antitoxin [Bacilli bacterium]
MDNNKIIETIKCEKCGGLMLKEITSYSKNYISKTITISDIEGYRCGKCGHSHIDKKVMNYINKRLMVEELKYKATQEKALILISKVKKVRLERGFSQKEAGEMLGFSEQRFGTIERNVNIPLVHIEHQLAKALNVEVKDLYEMIAITPEFHSKLVNLELIEKGNGEYTFNYIKEIEQIRKELKDKRLELEKYNIEKRTYRYLARTDPKYKEKAEKKIEQINKKIEEIKIEKDGPDRKSGLEKKFKDMLANYNIVLKQEKIIDYDDWQKILETYGEDILVR